MQKRYIYMLTTRIYKHQNSLTLETVDSLALDVFHPRLSWKKRKKTKEQNSKTTLIHFTSFQRNSNMLKIRLTF